jgi:outer membrane protein OmpA-like peptidoglycan-associated protein
VLGGAVGAGGGYIWSKKMQDQKAAMERATVGTGVAVSQTTDNRLKLDIPSDVSFDVGRSAIKPNFAPILNQFATSLNQNPVTTVTIIGHTDNTGSDAINNPLSIDRADSARDYLVSRGVARTRIVTDGRGSREPVADNSSQQGQPQHASLHLARRGHRQGLNEFNLLGILIRRQLAFDVGLQFHRQLLIKPPCAARMRAPAAPVGASTT